MGVTKEEVDWLYKVLFDRPVEDFGIYAWLDSSFNNFSTARTALLGSDEFSLRYSLACEDRRPTNSQAFAKIVDAFCHPTPRIEMLRPADFSSGDEQTLLDNYVRRSPIQVLLVIGSARALDIGLQIASRAEAGSTLYYLDEGNSQALELTHYNQDRFSVLRLPVPVSAFMARLRVEGVKLDVVVTDSSALTDDDYISVYPRLSDHGCLYDLGQPNRLRKLAANRAWETIEVGERTMLPRRTWPVPFKHKPSPPTASRSREKLAVATILKDEQDFIEGMIRSCAPVCGHMTIVDTGSTDDTLVIARRVLREVALSHDISTEPFVDFASARNSALSKVPRSFSWVFMLDADERLSPEDYAALADLLDGDFDAYMIPRYNYPDKLKTKEPFAYPDRQGRLIRNRTVAPIRYRGAVHEVLDNVGSWGLPPANLDALGRGGGGPHIHHFGYADISSETFAKKQSLYDRLQGR